MTDTATPTDPVQRIRAFFEQELGHPVEIRDYAEITGGYSRAMSRFTVAHAEGEQGYILRADPPPGTSILDTDRAQEWAVLQALGASGAVPLPAARWFDSTGERLGSPAIVIDRVDGESLQLRNQAVTKADRSVLAGNVAELLTRVHGCPLDGLTAVLEHPGDWDSYIDGRIRQWVDVERQTPWSVPFMRWVAHWLDANRPPAMPLTLVHGDFQPPNILIDRAGGMCLVDWELTHIGDPREDLGWWGLACASQPPDIIRDNMDDFCAAYRAGIGATEEQLNPSTIDYFTVLSSIDVYSSLLRQGALMARGETDAMGIAYMTVAEPFMHGVWLDAVARITAA